MTSGKRFFATGPALLALILAVAVIPAVLQPRALPSDPARAVRQPSSAIGSPSRDPNLDALPGFQSPPPGYGEVAFFWWQGDPLTKERLTWHLDQLAGKGITGLQINYAHTDKGGVSYGLTMPSDPPIFSPAWWELVKWFGAEAQKRGMSISLSDYTLGLGQGYAMDAAVADVPGLTGSELRHEAKPVEGGSEVDWTLPSGWLSVSGVPLAKAGDPAGQAIDLSPFARDGRLIWRAPEGRWETIAVFSRKVVPSLDPTHPASGRAYTERFFAPFEKVFPGQGGRTLNFFFSDELDFRLPRLIWSERLADEFRARKGYDLRPELAALFVDIGPRTPKVRLDYNDVRVALSEENFFRPVFAWHEARGMIYGCDHGGRGLDVTEFGDYFRTQRWNQGPGSDQPNLSKDLVKAKIAASIAHLYDRPRVWLEGYHSSGWGTTSAGIADATFANFLMGYNLLSFHGLYYSTHGGWWEWAPPDNHWRMPYWRHMSGFMTAVERLSYLLSQGRHVCDVAILYPVAPAEAGMDGKKAVDTAFEAGRKLYAAGIDFDFIDFESVLRAKIEGGGLSISGERYRVLVLPAMSAIRFAALEKAAAFAAAGGTVIAVGGWPEASDRAGRGDPVLDRLVAGLFRLEARETGGRAAVIPGPDGLAAAVKRVIAPDLEFDRFGNGSRYFQHRRVGPRDVYGLYGFPGDLPVWFRATGRAELWDPWTGRTEALPIEEEKDGRTRLRLPRSASEIQLIVFSPGRAEPETAQDRPTSESIEIEGLWTTEIRPTLDNRWGDFRWPPKPGFIGPEARRFRYAGDESGPCPTAIPRLETMGARPQTSSFGQMFWKIGPVPDGADVAAFEARLAGIAQLDPASPIDVGSVSLTWTPYDFSWRWGVEDDPGHQGYHGLKEEMSDDFIRLGTPKQEWTAVVREKEKIGSRSYLWTTVAAPVRSAARFLAGGMTPAAVWLRGRRVEDLSAAIELEPGANPLLLRYDRSGTGFLLVVQPDFRIPEAVPGSLAMRWFGADGIFPFDVRAGDRAPAGWYTFKAAPGLRAFTVTAIGEVEAWADGVLLRPDVRNAAAGGAKRLRFVPEKIVKGEAEIMLRIRHERGCYGGAALPEPVEFDCGEGELVPGDWSRVEGLESYSGGILFRKEIVVPPFASGTRISLDLGGVASSAEVFVNGQSCGVSIAPPWRWDIGSSVRPGSPNRIEVLIFNTLANHYLTIPTRYRGSPVSGLMGPVRLVMERR